MSSQIQKLIHDVSNHDRYPNFEFTEVGRQSMQACPFCHTRQFELCNTHTPSYWIACDCGAELHDVGRITYNGRASHLASVKRVIKAWNSR